MSIWWMFGIAEKRFAGAGGDVEVFAGRKDDLGLKEGWRGMRYGWRVSEVAKEVV